MGVFNKKVFSQILVVLVKKVLIPSIPLILNRKHCQKITLVIIPTCNNSQTNVRNLVKICVQAI